MSTSLQYQFKQQLCGGRQESGLKNMASLVLFLTRTRHSPCVGCVRKWPLKLARTRLSHISRTLRLPDDLTNRPYYRHFWSFVTCLCNDVVFIGLSKTEDAMARWRRFPLWITWLGYFFKLNFTVVNFVWKYANSFVCFLLY